MLGKKLCSLRFSKCLLLITVMCIFLNCGSQEPKATGLDQIISSSGEERKGHGLDLPDCMEKIKMGVVEALLAEAELKIKLFEPLEYPLNFQQLIDKGFLIVIPDNPVTGEPMEFSEEYSAGELYYNDDGTTYTFINHMAKCDPGYNEEQFTEGYLSDFYAGSAKSNGHSWWVEYASGVVSPQNYRESLKLNGRSSSESLRVGNLAIQVSHIVSKYSMIYSEPLNSLDDYLSWIGKKNSKAFFNPYTGSPMKLLPAAVSKGREPHPYEPDLNQNPDPQEYAGNYSEFTYLNSEGDRMIVFLFYYLDSEGELAASGLKGYPRKYWRKGIMEGFGMEYEGD